MQNKTYKYIRLNTLDDINNFLNQVQPEDFRIVTIDSTRKVWGIFQKGYAVFYWNEQNPIPNEESNPELKNLEYEYNK